jgi:hypothetical protein
MAIYNVNLNWDDEARVWYSTSEDFPTLILEDGSYDALIVRLKDLAVELLALKGITDKSLRLIFHSDRQEDIAA